MSIGYEQRTACRVGSPCRARVWPAIEVVLKNGTSAGRLRLTGGSTRTPKAALLVPSAFGCGAG
jgi:hypothetical protein